MTQSLEQHLLVYLGNRLIGRLYRRENLTRFVFEPDYWQDPDRLVLGLRFEEDRTAKHRANMRLPPWFSNLLPEGRLREWIARAGGLSVDREIDLLAQVGHDLPGAVRVLPASDSGSVDMSGADFGAPQSIQGQSSLWRFSLAGVGLKFSMLSRRDRLVAPAVGEGGDWIVKLPTPGFPDLAHNELAMMSLAGLVGIDVPEVRLVHRDAIESLPGHVWSGTGGYAYAVKRFDRGSAREPIHVEDFAQVRGFYPEAKYHGSYETLAALSYRNRDLNSLQEFTRRLTFNILIGNGDAHLKNWSLIYPDGRNATLAPAYDLVSTFVYRPSIEGPEQVALRLGGSKRFEDARPAMLDRLENRLGVDAGLASIGRSVAQAVIEKWPSAGALLGEYPEMRDKIERFIGERVKKWVS